MKLEFCIDSLAGVQAAVKYKVQRVELCSALDVGGLTPSYSMIEHCANSSVEVHVMIRPIAGDFIYDSQNLSVMLTDIRMAREAGAKGVVFGCLMHDHTLDEITTGKLVNTARNLGLETTFHRAFDTVEQPDDALEKLVSLGVNRILTSGQEKTAIQGKNLLKNIVEKANNRIEIMAGSGINAFNVQEICDTGVDALHFTIHQKNSTTAALGMGSRSTIDFKKIESILSLI